MSKSMMARSGSDTLVTIVNKIFSILIDTIHEFGGDVLKFAGQFQIFDPLPGFVSQYIYAWFVGFD
jgi:hypothetical protein